MLGVIGGSGVYRLDDLQDSEERIMGTPFGAPSGPVRTGTIGGTPVAFIPRHGPGHRFSPTDLPYRANMFALKALGVSHIVSVSAVGSLRESLPPRTRVVPDQIIDRTIRGGRTFFTDGVVGHVGMADPYCPLLRSAVAKAGAASGNPVHVGGTYICIEGPQFSTRAESNMYRSWGADVIGMTAMPEARLAREAEICYATLALVTDFDVWHESEEDVTVELVLGHLRANSAAAASIIEALAAAGLPQRGCACDHALDGAIMTDPALVPDERRRALGVLGARVLPHQS
ncbi:MAG: S-methyl-5'-thioadenosine phosphorylase [Thermomicrobiales bacterium]